ncbi:hypothetical protein TrCOL_g827, partial [Triparma columacea]
KNKKLENDGLTAHDQGRRFRPAGLVLAGCNSLIFIDGEVAGDPLESAALKAMRWEVKGETGKIRPKAKTEKREEGKAFTVNNTKTKEITVLHRHHFSSKLQPMSCIILILEKADTGMFWKKYSDDSKFKDYVADNVPALAKEGYELSTTGKNKETVIENLQAVNHLCLMCGDGANDVGALKADNVGIALLSGFGDVNMDKGEDSNKKNGALPGKGGETAMISTQEILALTPKSTALRRSPTWSSSGGRRAWRQPS